MQRIFHEKNDPKSPDFKEKKSKLSDFYGKFAKVAKNIKGFWLFPDFSYLVCSQNFF
jgi:hypothetical protein